MEVAVEVIKKDLTASIEFLEEEKFNNLGMKGNSIIDNAALLNMKTLMIYGLLVQDVADEIIQTKKRNKDNVDDCKEISKSFIKNLYIILDEEKGVNFAKIWEAYSGFKTEINHYNKSDTELVIYNGTNVEFTSEATSTLIEHLKNNKELLLRENDGLLFGVLNEETRLIKYYGFRDKDLLFYLLLNALMRYYIILSELDFQIADNRIDLRKKIYNYIDNILRIIESDEKTLTKESNDLIGNMLYNSTIYIINYYAGIQKSKKRDKEYNKMNLLPKKSKEKIGKIIEEAIEKELKK